LSSSMSGAAERSREADNGVLAKKKSKARNESAIGFKKGDVVGAKWRIEKSLGRGAFGEIFRTLCLDKNHRWYGCRVATKVETQCVKTEKRRCILKLEAIVLKRLQFCDYVARFIEYGYDKKTQMHYLCMSQLGDNLLKLRKRHGQGGTKFSLATVLRLGMQGVRSIEGMHKVSTRVCVSEYIFVFVSHIRVM
jgi:hypothetical protein